MAQDDLNRRIAEALEPEPTFPPSGIGYSPLQLWMRGFITDESEPEPWPQILDGDGESADALIRALQAKGMLVIERHYPGGTRCVRVYDVSDGDVRGTRRAEIKGNIPRPRAVRDAAASALGLVKTEATP